MSDYIPSAVKKGAARAAQLVEEQAAARRAAASPEPAPAPAPAPEPAPAPAPEPAPLTSQSNPPLTVEEADHRYNSMRGRYERSEVTNRQLSAQIQDMQRVMALMTAEAPSAPIANGDTRFAGGRLVTPAEELEYGPEMIDIVGRRAREVLSPEVEALKSQIATLERRLGGVTQVVAQDSRAKMFETLDREMPAWRAVNTDQKFISWLALPDDFSGDIRQNLLNQAIARNDAARVTRFFEGFLAHEAALSPERGQGDRPGATPPALSLDNLAAPGRARQAASGNLPLEKPSFTRAQVSDFYRKVNTNYFVGKEAERAELEKAIFEAGKDGRIRG